VPGVANTTQKGSLLIFPQITVDPEDGSDTFIEISNDQNLTVNVECFYVNENKDRDNFSFVITANGTVSWDVKTQASDHVTPNTFPTGVRIPAPTLLAGTIMALLVAQRLFLRVRGFSITAREYYNDRDAKM
jgi:hypothetical protein